MSSRISASVRSITVSRSSYPAFSNAGQYSLSSSVDSHSSTLATESSVAISFSTDALRLRRCVDAIAVPKVTFAAPSQAALYPQRLPYAYVLEPERPRLVYD